MSVWNDIRRRGIGADIKGEDFSQVYTGEKVEGTELYSDQYKDLDYTIYTNGQFPYIKIMADNNITAFSGYNLVVVYEDGKRYDFDRVVEGNKVGYMYFCNREDDYVEGEHDGKKYSLDMLKSMAEKFIDLIISKDDKYWDYVSKHD